MATQFKQRLVKGIGTSGDDLVLMETGFRCTVIGLNLVNVTDGVVVTNIFLISDPDSTIGYYAKDVIIPPNTSLKVITQGEKLILSEHNGIRVFSNVDSSIDATISYVEIT